jgi:hypothetical protein
MLIIKICLWVAFGLCGGLLMARKGYPPYLGVVAGIVFGPIGLIVAALMPKTAKGREMAEQNKKIAAELRATRHLRVCPKCGRENSIASPVCPRCDYHYA